jgi:hypothetical protein
VLEDLHRSLRVTELHRYRHGIDAQARETGELPVPAVPAKLTPR